MGVKQFDWNAIRAEYITGQISQRDLCTKYGVSYSKLGEIARKEKWTEQKRKYEEKVFEKAIQKQCDREANRLAKELAVADKISDVLVRALNDEDQFRRWLSEDIYMDEDGGKVITSTEKIHDKVDMRSLKDAAATLKMVEQLKRSIEGLLTLQERNALNLAERRMTLEERRADAEKEADTTVTIRFEGDDLKEWSE